MKLNADGLKHCLFGASAFVVQMLAEFLKVFLSEGSSSMEGVELLLTEDGRHILTYERHILEQRAGKQPLSEYKLSVGFCFKNM